MDFIFGGNIYTLFTALPIVFSYICLYLEVMSTFTLVSILPKFL